MINSKKQACNNMIKSIKQQIKNECPYVSERFSVPLIEVAQSESDLRGLCKSKKRNPSS